MDNFFSSLKPSSICMIMRLYYFQFERISVMIAASCDCDANKQKWN